MRNNRFNPCSSNPEPSPNEVIEPLSPEEALERIDTLEVAIRLINEQLADASYRGRYESQKNYDDWRHVARASRLVKSTELKMLKTWLRQRDRAEATQATTLQRSADKLRKAKEQKLNIEARQARRAQASAEQAEAEARHKERIQRHQARIVAAAQAAEIVNQNDPVELLNACLPLIVRLGAIERFSQGSKDHSIVIMVREFLQQKDLQKSES